MITKELPIEYRQVFEMLKVSVNTFSHSGLKKASIGQIEAFSQQYLSAVSTLSRLRANPQLKSFVPGCQKVLVDANILLYPEESLGFKQVTSYFWTTLPAQLWQNRLYYLLSVAICGASTVVGFLIVLQNFEMAQVMMPASLRSNHELEEYLFSTHAQSKMLMAGRGDSASGKSLFATFLMVNNIKVAIICFVTGVLFAIPTLILLIQTGLMLGTLPALFYKGDLYGLGAWLLPHGVPEIGAILFAGGAGLKLGFSMLENTSYGVAIQLRKALNSIVGTILVCILMLIWAGLVESFVRQSALSNEVRYLIAACSLIPLVLLFVRAFLADRELSARLESL